MTSVFVHSVQVVAEREREKPLKMTNAHMTQEHDNITYINTLTRLNTIYSAL